jgi:malonyl-CoA/methylmalonyl-CoA synthetase
MQSNDNLYALLSARFCGVPDAVAFEEPARAMISYGQLERSVARYANALASLGVGAGDRVTVQVEKSLANVYLYLATLSCGAVFNPLNTAYTPVELDYFVSDAQPLVVVCDPGRLDSIREIARARGVAHVMTLDAMGSGSLADAAAAQPDEFAIVPRSSGDLAALIYTSGTTGRSKGAMLTHGNLASNALTLHRLWAFEPGDVLIHALPIFHVHGLYVALNTAFLNASKIIWLAKFDAATVADVLPSATILMGVPTFYTRLLAEPAFDAGLSRNMRLFISGSAPLLTETHKLFEERTGHRILERYGMTEAGMITSNPYVGERRAGTVGYALPDIEVRVAGGNGQALAPGEIGILEIKGPNVFKGYWGMPEKTAEEFRADGYFITGDMAVMDEDGRVAIVGRGKDLIITGGFNVYPKEIEGELDAIAGIGESAVIGVPHPDFGESVVAVVTAAGSGAPDEQAIISSLAERLAKFKVPKRVFLVDDLPRNTMGKVQKAELRSRYAETFEPAP